MSEPAIPDSAPVVIKVGGSLLDLPDLPRRLRRALDLWPGAPLVLVAGGGAAADRVRVWDRSLGLGEERAHRLALSAMTFNGSFLAEMLPGVVVASGRREIEEALGEGSLPVVDPRAFIEAEEPEAPEPLPHLWDAGSDSVAAWIAGRLSASELALMKSAPPLAGATLEHLAALGYVDPYLPRLARAIPAVSAVDLRAGEPARVVIKR